MHKDESGVESWVKHTRNVYGGRRRVNKGVRRNARVKLRGRIRSKNSNRVVTECDVR